MSSKLNKSDLNKSIAEKHGLTERQTDAILDDFLAGIVAGVAEHGEVDLHKFGTFTAQVTAARKGRNPRTGEEIHIPEKRRPKFKAWKAFKDSVEVQKFQES